MTSYKYLFITAFFISTALQSRAQNIMISDTNSPNEPSIMMDPNNPGTIVAAANIDNYYLSSDTGRTWEIKTLSSTYGVWGDPVIDVDTSGDFYFFHLSNPPSGNWIDRIVCQKSTNKGQTWTDGTYFGLNGAKAQDKQWSIVNRKNNHIYVTWTQFDLYGSTSQNDRSSIFFTKSTDLGDTWETPVKINKVDGNCVDKDSTTEGAVPAIGPNGEIYTAWAGPNGIVFNKSLDEGVTWLNDEIHVDPMPGGWDLAVPSISRCNGLPVTKCDLSGGNNNGTIYINWSDQRNGLIDTDIWLSKSKDGGDTWSSPVRVNDDPPGKHQFLTWMDIDQTTGHLYFIFYDRRNHNDDFTDVYVARSTDGGNTFFNVKISESPFLPNQGIFFGDYTNIVAHNNIIRPIWNRLHAGQTSIWTDISVEDSLFVDVKEVKTESIEAHHYPNPASNMFYFSFKLRKRSLIDLSIYDQSGRKVWTEFNNEEKDFGKYIVEFDLNKMGLNQGVYFCKLVVNSEEKVVKKLIVE